MKTKTKMTMSIAATMLAFGQQAGADHQEPIPRGQNVGLGASMCDIAGFPKLGKAGHYNGHCDELTDAEKCLSILKYSISDEGVLAPRHFFQDRAQHCLDTFKAGLIAPEAESE